MATRTLSTKLAITGEKEYRAAMKNINAELALNRSELERTEAVYRREANSLEALTAKESVQQKQLDALGRKHAEHAAMLERANALQRKYAYEVEQSSLKLERAKAKLEELRSSEEDTSEAEARLRQEIEKHAKALEGARTAQQMAANSARSYQKELNYTERDQAKLNDSLEETKEAISEAKSALDGIGDSVDEFGQEVKGADSALGSAGGAALKFGDILKANLASGVILGALKKLGGMLLDFGKDAVEAGKAFGAAMSQVAATMGVPVRQVRELQEFAKEMGATTAFSAEEAAQGLNTLAQAGLSAKEQMAALPDTLNLAAAGTLSLESAAAYVTGSIKGFKDEMANAQYYTDLIAKGATMANTSVAGLGEALSRGAATANGYGQSAESLTLSLLRLAEQNLEGEAASTALNRAMADLYTPTEAARKALEELGFSAYDEAEAARDFNEAVDALNQSLAGMTGEQRNAALATIFTTQGLDAFNKMIATSPDKLEEFRSGLEGAFGSAAQQAETQLDNLAGDMTLLDSAVDGLKIAVSERLSPALREAAQAATGAVSALTELVAVSEEELPILVSGTNELMNTIRESTELYENNSAAIQQSRADMLSRVDSLERLAGMEQRTMAQEQAMADLVEELNQTIPGLALAYDQETGSLNMTAEALRRVAEAEAERLERAEAARRLSVLDEEHKQIVNDLEAAESQLAEAQERRAALSGVFGKDVREASTAVTQAARSVERLEAALVSNEVAASYFLQKYGDLRNAVEDTSSSMEKTKRTAANLTEAYEDMQASTQALISETDLLKAALDEQAESGSLNLDTALKLIDAGYSTAVAIDTETGAVTLNKEEYIRLAQVKLEDQIASLEVQKESARNAAALAIESNAAYNAGSAYWEAAKGKAALAANGDAAAIDAQIAALKRLQQSVGSYTGTVQSSARTASSAARSAATTAEKAKTQAEEDLETYKAMTAELEYRRNLDAVSEKEYYDALAQYRDQFLTDDANVDEYRKITEEIYKYDKTLGEKEAQLWIEQTETLIDELEERYKKVLDEQDRMAEQLADYGDLYSIDKESGMMSLEDIQKHIDAVEEYRNVLSDLRERGISESLMDEVLAMDNDTATQYGKLLLEKTNEEWDEYNSLWEEKQQQARKVAEEFYKEELDALENEYNSKLGESLDGMKETAFNSGAGTVEGLIEGLKSKEGALYAEMQAIAQQASAILASAGASFSPENLRVERGVTARDVMNVGEAVVNGVSAASWQPSGDAHFTFNLNGRTFAEATYSDFRNVNRANPEVKDDR